MKNIGRMHSFQRTQSLVDEILAMVIREVLSADDSVHVGFHELLRRCKSRAKGFRGLLLTNLDEINFGEALIVPGLLDVQNTDDVFVVKVTQQFHLTQRSQAKHAMVKRRNLLDGNLLAGRLVKRGAVETSQSAS